MPWLSQGVPGADGHGDSPRRSSPVMSLQDSFSVLATVPLNPFAGQENALSESECMPQIPCSPRSLAGSQLLEAETV